MGIACRTTQQNAALVEENTAALATAGQMIAALNQTIARFQIDESEAA